MKPELLAPCHDFATLKAAINAGADGIYFGVVGFNMRAGASNFKVSELSKVVRACHSCNVKAYLTTNTVVFDNEFSKLKRLLKSALKVGIDAVIVHDLGVLKLAREVGLKCHVSVQANITNSLSISSYKKLGASRVILSRELSLAQIKKIINKSVLPIECFVHGALCVSISGRCFFSETLDAKSANRGECVQPCRREWRVTTNTGSLVYDGARFLNSMDLCMIEHVPELIKAGVKSFKIEGRMRDANYVSTVVSCYREAIDDFSASKIPVWLERLGSVFNRGFCTGFYYGSPKVSLKASGNLSVISKRLVGEVLNYYPRVNVAEVRLSHDSLSINDEIIIEGKSTFLKQFVNSLELDYKPVNHAIKDSVIGIKIVKRARIGDLVYKLVKKS